MSGNREDGGMKRPLSSLSPTSLPQHLDLGSGLLRDWQRYRDEDKMKINDKKKQQPCNKKVYVYSGRRVLCIHALLIWTDFVSAGSELMLFFLCTVITSVFAVACVCVCVCESANFPVIIMNAEQRKHEHW